MKTSKFKLIFGALIVFCIGIFCERWIILKIPIKSDYKMDYEIKNATERTQNLCVYFIYYQSNNYMAPITRDCFILDKSETRSLEAYHLETVNKFFILIEIFDPETGNLLYKNILDATGNFIIKDDPLKIVTESN